MQNWVLTELDSGERVISERLDHVRSAAVGFWIGAGSRDEEAGEAGVTHFIEHLLFKGTDRYSAVEIAEIFDGLGGELNAATSREHTLVYARIPDHHLETAVDVMTDMVFAPAFAELDSEREVVLEEIAMYDDAPQELVHDLIAEAVFGDHPLGRPVIGTAEVISSIPRAAIARYHDTMYVPGNIVVAAAGNIEHDRVVELVTRGLERRAVANGSPPPPRPPPRPPPPPPRRSSRLPSLVSASSRRTPSSTTSAWPHPASHVPTVAGSPRRCSTQSSAAPRRRGSSRRSARSGGWRTPSTRSSRSTRTPGRSGSTSARARTTSPRR